MLAPGESSFLSAGWTLLSADWTKDDLPKLTKATFIGILVAITGNVLISLALNLQKLAHKRVEAETRVSCEGENGNRNSQNGFQRRRSEEPSLDEQDEDDMQTMSPSCTTSPASGPAESERLIPFPPSAQYGSISESSETNGSSTTDNSRSSPTFVSRLIPVWIYQNKSAPSTSSPHLEGLIPVDVISEEAALRQQDPKVNQKHDMVENGHETNYLKSKLWWLGFLLMNVGETGNFISYAWAPASVVAPLGTFALMANCLFAPLLLGERFRSRDLLGILIAIIGAVTVVLASNSSDTRLDPDALLDAISQTPFIVYSCVYLVGGIILGTLSLGELGRQSVFIDVGMCALFGGFTVLSTKAISTLLTLEWITMFTNWITYPILAVLAITGVGQIRYLNRALMRFDSKVVIPVQFVLFTLSAIIGSAILYGDFKRAKFHQVVTFLYGCAATFLGVFIIAWAPGSETSGDDPEHGFDPGPVSNTTSNDGPRLGLGTLGRKNRATLMMPGGAMDAPGTRNQHNVSLIGLSPAQHLLLVHTPPRDVPIHGQIQPLAGSNRRRTMSWLGDGTCDGVSPGGTEECNLGGWRGRAGNRVGSLDNDI